MLERAYKVNPRIIKSPAFYVIHYMVIKKIQIKRFDFLENIGYIMNSIPAAPLLKSMRNSMGFFFYREFAV